MTTEVKTTGGLASVSSATSEGFAFLGLPYAEPPFGEHRFREPRAAAWDGVRPCDAYGATAPQPAQGFTIIPEPIIDGDDCLNLNVFTPELGEARLPVLVWIHGGGFVNGCNASPWYHGRSFCCDGVVVVAVNYRLGIEGFLPLEGAHPNRALLDWLLALEWVRDNVAAFGGDPDDVTIAGQSAGGAACATLLATPSARGLFGKAILMSGVANHVRNLDEGRRFAERVAGALGIAPTREAFAAVDRERMITVQQELGTLGDGGAEPSDAAARLAGIARGGMRYGPLVDGDLLPEAPLSAAASGVNADIPVLLGTTSEETDAMAHLVDGMDDDTLLAGLVAAGLSDEDARSYRGAYPDEDAVAVLGHAMTDAMFRVPAVRMAEARGGARTWMYESRWRSPTGFGAVHCLDVPFVFDLLDAEAVAVVAGGEPPQVLADSMHRTWVDFIKDGQAAWPTYESENRAVMAFDADDVDRSHVVHDPHVHCRTRFDGFRPPR